MTSTRARRWNIVALVASATLVIASCGVGARGGGDIDAEFTSHMAGMAGVASSGADVWSDFALGPAHIEMEPGATPQEALAAYEHARAFDRRGEVGDILIYVRDKAGEVVVDFSGPRRPDLQIEVLAFADAFAAASPPEWWTHVTLDTPGAGRPSVTFVSLEVSSDAQVLAAYESVASLWPAPLGLGGVGVSHLGQDADFGISGDDFEVIDASAAALRALEPLFDIQAFSIRDSRLAISIADDFTPSASTLYGSGLPATAPGTSVDLYVDQPHLLYLDQKPTPSIEYRAGSGTTIRVGTRAEAAAISASLVGLPGTAETLFVWKIAGEDGLPPFEVTTEGPSLEALLPTLATH